PTTRDIGTEGRTVGYIPAALGRVVRGKRKQSTQPLRMAHCDIETNDPAIAPTDQRHLVDLQKIEQCQIVIRHLRVAERLVCAGTASMTAAVSDDHHVVLAQLRDLETPDVAVTESSVNQQHRLSFAVYGVIHPYPIDGCHPTYSRMRH